MLFLEVVNKDLFSKLSSNGSDVLISDCKGIKKVSCAFTTIDSDTNKKTIITLILSKEAEKNVKKGLRIIRLNFHAEI